MTQILKRSDSFGPLTCFVQEGPTVNDPDKLIGVFTTRDAAEDFVARDPFVQNGLVASWRIGPS